MTHLMTDAVLLDLHEFAEVISVSRNCQSQAAIIEKRNITFDPDDIQQYNQQTATEVAIITQMKLLQSTHEDSAYRLSSI